MSGGPDELSRSRSMHQVRSTLWLRALLVKFHPRLARREVRGARCEAKEARDSPVNRADTKLPTAVRLQPG